MGSNVIRVFIFAALLWGGCGFFATTASLHSQPRLELPSSELKQKIGAFDRVLLKSIGTWVFVGLLSASFCLYLLTLSQIPGALRFALVVFYGIAMGLCFALWHYPRVDLAGTSGILAGQNRRILVCCALALVATLSTLGRVIKAAGGHPTRESL